MLEEYREGGRRGFVIILEGCDGLGWGRFSAELGWGMVIFQTWTGGRNQVGFLQKTHDGVGWVARLVHRLS